MEMGLGHILVCIDKDLEVFSPLPISRNGAEIVESEEKLLKLTSLI